MGHKKPMAWDVKVPDTYADSYIDITAVKPGAAAYKAAQSKIDKYARLDSMQIFYLFAIETVGMWHDMAIELTHEIGRHVAAITEDTRETTFLFMAVHGSSNGKYSILLEYHDHQMKLRCSHLHLLNFSVHAYTLCTGGH